MARWTGTWLSGLGAAGVQVRDPAERARRLGLPVEGPGAVAPLGPRAAAFVVDLVLATLIGGLLNVVVDAPTDVQRNLAATTALAVLYVVGLLTRGQTPGMRLTGVRVIALRDGPALGLVPAVLRTALLLTFVLALVSDRDGRGLHDKAARTVVVRA